MATFAARAIGTERFAYERLREPEREPLLSNTGRTVQEEALWERAALQAA